MAVTKKAKRGTAPRRTSATTSAKRKTAARPKAAAPKRRSIKRIDVTPSFMEKNRVARFKKLRSSTKGFIDTKLPFGERDILNVIGRGVVEDASLLPPIKDNKDFNVGFIRAKKNHGATLHIHETNEVFIPITGKWGIFWQNTNGKKHEVVLEPLDTVSVPIGLSRGFRYLGRGEGLMLAIVGGTDPGRVHWPKETIELAEKHGFMLKDGDLVEVDSSAK